ncbi:MAG: molybdopterin converting factor, subunit 1 [Edaphobacter sp.]|nr:molybdopterin converting factor, subunit 1 [Edaphobacter sp.]
MFAGLESQRSVLAYSVGMRVQVLYFGILKDAFGGESEVVELAQGASVADLIKIYREREVGRAGVWDSIAVAVNQEYAQAGDVLQEGDEVALLPPVSGGCSV